MDTIDRDNVMAMCSHEPEEHTPDSIFTPDDLAEAARELEQEQAERAMAWDKARKAVTDAKTRMAISLFLYDIEFLRPATIAPMLAQDAKALVQALHEVERLEALGV